MSWLTSKVFPKQTMKYVKVNIWNWTDKSRQYHHLQHHGLGEHLLATKKTEIIFRKNLRYTVRYKLHFVISEWNKKGYKILVKI